MTGSLVLVGTPIGNLGDISDRARQALAAADVVACEDTRRTGRLLAALAIDAPRLVVVNEHTEDAMAAELARLASAGSTVALVTDAGMPAISDPGARVVRAAVDAGVPVSVVPGPSALDAAVALSGLVTGPFSFEGFLPRKGAARARRVESVAADERPVVLYEAPHRVLRTLSDLLDAAGPDRPVVLAREITKLHEEVWRGSLGEAVAHLEATPPRGEYVVVLAGASPPEVPADADLLARVEELVDAGWSTRDAVDEVARRTGASRRHVYNLTTTR